MAEAFDSKRNVEKFHIEGGTVTQTENGDGSTTYNVTGDGAVATVHFSDATIEAQRHPPTAPAILKAGSSFKVNIEKGTLKGKDVT